MQKPKKILAERKHMFIQLEMEKPKTIIHNGIKFYPCIYSGRLYFRSASTTGKLLHRVIWEDVNGPIPAGYHIHHKNNNPADNRIENLELKSKSAHFLIHHDPVESGKMGGKAGVGVAKARSAEQARAAANARWAKSHQVSAEIRAALKEGVAE